MRKKKRQRTDLARQEQRNDTRGGSPSHSSSCAQFVQASVGETTKQTHRTGAHPSQETGGKSKSSKRHGNAKIELRENRAANEAPNSLSGITSPTYRSMNYWNNDALSGAAEVNNILHDLEQDQLTRGNVDANQYKRVLQNLLSNYHRRHFSGGSLGGDATFLQIDDAA